MNSASFEGSLAGPLSTLLANLVSSQARRDPLSSLFDGAGRRAPAIPLASYIER